MSLVDFRDYYENVHCKLCEKYTYGVRRYVRRYLEPLPAARDGAVAEMPFDVITEIWFDDATIFGKAVEMTAQGVLPPEIDADEPKLFDRGTIRHAVAVECDSDPASLNVPRKRSR